MGLMGEWPDAIDPTQIGQRIADLRETDTLLLDACRCRSSGRGHAPARRKPAVPPQRHDPDCRRR
jgi:hypothetical protein